MADCSMLANKAWRWSNAIPILMISHLQARKPRCFAELHRQSSFLHLYEVKMIQSCMHALMVHQQGQGQDISEAHSLLTALVAWVCAISIAATASR